MELEGKKALVTGGAVRIGRAISGALARAGCETVVHYHASHSAAEELCASLAREGRRCVSLQADLAQAEECQSLLSRAREALGNSGAIEILVHNAALFPRSNLDQTDLETWETLMAVNLRAPFLLSQELIRQLPVATQASIVSISDARVGHAGGPLAYQLSKAALDEMTRLLAFELAPRVRVNSVAPGAILEPVDESRNAFLERVERRLPLRRSGGPESVAEAVLYLLREDFLTGAILRLDGGEYL